MSNNASVENKKMVLNRKNRGAKMMELEGNMDKMLYEEKDQWLFLEESSDDDFDPNEKVNQSESNVEGEDDEEDNDSSYKEEYEEYNKGDDKELKSNSNNNKEEKKNNFLFKRKRGEAISNEEIYDIDQINIEKIDNNEMKKEIRKQKKKKTKVLNDIKGNKSSNSSNNNATTTHKALFNTTQDRPPKKVLFKISPGCIKDT